MDSPARTNPKFIERLTPVWAVFLDDIRQTVRHWAFLSWGTLALLAAVTWFSSLEGTAAEFGARVVGAHLLLWAAFVIAIGATAISGEADVAAEAILCRGVSRWQYYLAKCGGRFIMVTALFALLTAPALLLAQLRLTDDMTMTSALRGLGVGVAYLGCLTLIGVAAGSWFTSPLLSVAVSWMCLYGIGFVISILEISGLSPVGLSAQMPGLLRGDADALADHHLIGVLTTIAVAGATVSAGCYSLRDA